MRGSPRADNADGMVIALLQFAPDVEHDWRRVDFPQWPGIRWRFLRDHGRAEITNPFQLRAEIDSVRKSTYAVERIAREDLGMSKKGEVVYMLPRK